MREMSMANPVTCLFHFFVTLNGAFEVLFFNASFVHLIKDTVTCTMKGPAAPIFKSGNIVKQCL